MIKKLVISICFCLILSPMVLGQSDFVQPSSRNSHSPVSSPEFMHTWAMGPLTWNDFLLRYDAVEHNSYLEYFLQVQNKTIKKDGIKYKIPTLVAYTSPDYSWVKPDFRSDDQLAYNQCIFDVIEIHRRRLEKELITQEPIYFPRFIDKSFVKINKSINELCQSTLFGSNLVEVKNRKNLYTQVLDTMPIYHVSGIDSSAVYLGVNLGGGYKVLSDDFAELFADVFGVNLNIDVLADKHYFTLGSLLGWSKCLQDIDYSDSQPLFDLGNRISLLDIYLGYGYSVVNTNRHRLSPFVGVGFERYYRFDGLQRVGTLAFNYRFGLDYNYIFQNMVRHGSWELELPKFNARQLQSSVNVKLFASYSNHSTLCDTPQGLSFNFQLGYGFHTRNVRYH